MAKVLYIIAGCNGAGKSTASFTVLPHWLHIKNFVNADEIAKGIAPFQPEKAAFASGRIMLEQIEKLIEEEESFAIETTLATKSYVQKIRWAKSKKYKIRLIYIYLPSKKLAIQRVKERVLSGGHHIPASIIRRRYDRGLHNLFYLYKNEVDQWLILENSTGELKLIAEGKKDYTIFVHDKFSFDVLVQKAKNKR